MTPTISSTSRLETIAGGRKIVAVAGVHENAIIKNLVEICGDDAVTHYRPEENDDEMGFFDFLGEENDAEAEEEEDEEEEEEE